MTISTVSRLVCGVCLLALAARAPGAEADTAPARLLAEAAELARADSSRGSVTWNTPLVLLRVADTMRLHGLRDQARATLRDARQRNAKVTTEECRDQIVIELCRLFTLVGESAEAESLAPSAAFRDYYRPARVVSARSALEAGDPAVAAALLRHKTLLEPDAENKGRGGELWRRAAMRLAVDMGQMDLARQLTEVIKDPFWKSAALGDLAVSEARAGRRDEALKIVAASPDAYMVVIGLARVADALARRNAAEPLGAVLEALEKAAAKVSNPTERDHALGVAVSRLAAAGRSAEAGRLMRLVEGPIARLRAQCELLSPEQLPAAEESVAACPEAERPLAQEYLALACARHAMGAAAREIAGRVQDPWQRCRSQATCARILAGLQRPAEAVEFAQAAAASAKAVEPAGWRLRAHVRVALDAERAGLATLADQQLAFAREAFAGVTEPDVQPGLVVGLAEALAALKRKAVLQQFATDVLKTDLPAAARDRLLPVLAGARAIDLVVAECNRTRPSAAARREIIYRLARQGKLAEALAMIGNLSGTLRAEALADIALAQVPTAPIRAPEERPVGVALNGGWAAWFPRLERMGMRWELMACSEPYELGPAGLAARYAGIGYPGAGGHEVYTGVAGIENLRDYLYAGGGLKGICAGQYLSTRAHYTEADSIGMGCPSCPHQVQMRKPHLVALGLPAVITISRRNGGILIPRPGCEVLGWYDTIERYAALVAQDYGYGRVVALSPHPEGGGGLDPRDHLCINALNWITRGLP